MTTRHTTKSAPKNAPRVRTLSDDQRATLTGIADANGMTLDQLTALADAFSESVNVWRPRIVLTLDYVNAGITVKQMTAALKEASVIAPGIDAVSARLYGVARCAGEILVAAGVAVVDNDRAGADRVDALTYATIARDVKAMGTKTARDVATATLANLEEGVSVADRVAMIIDAFKSPADQARADQVAPRAPRTAEGDAEGAEGTEDDAPRTPDTLSDDELMRMLTALSGEVARRLTAGKLDAGKYGQTVGAMATKLSDALTLSTAPAPRAKSTKATTPAKA